MPSFVQSGSTYNTKMTVHDARLNLVIDLNWSSVYSFHSEVWDVICIGR